MAGRRAGVSARLASLRHPVSGSLLEAHSGSCLRASRESRYDPRPPPPSVRLPAPEAFATLRSPIIEDPSMPQMTMVQALQDALRVALRDDPTVVVLGEDVGRNGGVFRVTEGLQAEFGSERVADTPLSENGIVGGAIGMALYGLRPVAEIQFVDFIYPAFDQIVSEMAKMRWRSAGQYSCPVVVRAPYGGGIKGGLYHSQSPEAYFCHTAGLKVVIPATPRDAKGLLLESLASVSKTGRVVIVHEAPRTCGYGAELAALVAEKALTSLQAPVLRVTGYDTPFPYTLEHTYLPDAPRVLRAIEHVMSY